MFLKAVPRSGSRGGGGGGGGGGGSTAFSSARPQSGSHGVDGGTSQGMSSQSGSAAGDPAAMGIVAEVGRSRTQPKEARKPLQ